MSSSTGSRLVSTLATAVSRMTSPVALDPAPVVGVLGLQPLQVGGALGELTGQLVDDVAAEAVGRGVRHPRGRGSRRWPAPAARR